MQTAIPENKRKHPQTKQAEDILRSCVHCGFCNATCPTYQLNGVETEGPRGRIYLIKSVLEDQLSYTPTLVEHLDNCLSCLSCMTTCPSGVNYSHLIDAARIQVEKNFTRSLFSRLQRKMLAGMLPHPKKFKRAMTLAALVKPFAFMLPRPLKHMVSMAPSRLPAPSLLDKPGVRTPAGKVKAKATMLTGCAQKVMGPNINDASFRLLERMGVEVHQSEGVGCCGALVYHMGNERESLPLMKNNIDHWHGLIESEKLDYIIINTSGCGSVVKDYGHIFAEDPLYKEKAAKVAAITKDISEVIAEVGLPPVKDFTPPGAVAYHDACSLQHGQKIRESPRALLQEAGFEVVDIPDGHMCCGSAGTYNILKPLAAEELGKQKVENIALTKGVLVAAGNIGCMEQIAQHGPLPVVHTVELLDWATGGPEPLATRCLFVAKATGTRQ